MRRFRYALDPLGLLACGLYAVIRWLIRPHTAAAFWHEHATDCLFIPAAMPWLLWMHRRLGLRKNDAFPAWSEIGLTFAVWSVATEGVAPLVFPHAVGDWLDVAAYAAGAAFAGGWWTLAGRPGFDLLAPHYTWMEKLLAGPRLQRCRTAWLDAVGTPRRVLIAGIGHGRFLHEFLPRHPGAHVTCLDASAGMLREAEARARKAGLDLARVEFVHARLPAWAPAAGGYDLIVTNFFLDCFAPVELAAVVAGLAAAATPDARWLLADFALPETRLARWRALAVHQLMYVFFRCVTRLPAKRWTAPDIWLETHGFSLAGRLSSEWGLLRADYWRRGAA